MMEVGGCIIVETRVVDGNGGGGGANIEVP